MLGIFQFRFFCVILLEIFFTSYINAIQEIQNGEIFHFSLNETVKYYEFLFHASFAPQNPEHLLIRCPDKYNSHVMLYVFLEEDTSRDKWRFELGDGRPDFHIIQKSEKNYRPNSTYFFRFFLINPKVQKSEFDFLVYGDSSPVLVSPGQLTEIITHSQYFNTTKIKVKTRDMSNTFEIKRKTSYPDEAQAKRFALKIYSEENEMNDPLFESSFHKYAFPQEFAVTSSNYYIIVITNENYFTESPICSFLFVQHSYQSRAQEIKEGMEISPVFLNPSRLQYYYADLHSLGTRETIFRISEVAIAGSVFSNIIQLESGSSINRAIFENFEGENEFIFDRNGELKFYNRKFPNCTNCFFILKFTIAPKDIDYYSYSIQLLNPPTIYHKINVTDVFTFSNGAPILLQLNYTEDQMENLIFYTNERISTSINFCNDVPTLLSSDYHQVDQKLLFFIHKETVEYISGEKFISVVLSPTSKNMKTLHFSIISTRIGFEVPFLSMPFGVNKITGEIFHDETYYILNQVSPKKLVLYIDFIFGSGKVIAQERLNNISGEYDSVLDILQENTQSMKIEFNQTAVFNSYIPGDGAKYLIFKVKCKGPCLFDLYMAYTEQSRTELLYNQPMLFYVQDSQQLFLLKEDTVDYVNYAFKSIEGNGDIRFGDNMTIKMETNNTEYKGIYKADAQNISLALESHNKTSPWIVYFSGHDANMTRYRKLYPGVTIFQNPQNFYIRFPKLGGNVTLNIIFNSEIEGEKYIHVSYFISSDNITKFLNAPSFTTGMSQVYHNISMHRNFTNPYDKIGQDSDKQYFLVVSFIHPENLYEDFPAVTVMYYVSGSVHSPDSLWIVLSIILPLLAVILIVLLLWIFLKRAKVRDLFRRRSDYEILSK